MNLRERKSGKYVGQTRIAHTGRLHPFIVTPDGCSDMAGGSIASLKAER